MDTYIEKRDKDEQTFEGYCCLMYPDFKVLERNKILLLTKVLEGNICLQNSNENVLFEHFYYSRLILL